MTNREYITDKLVSLKVPQSVMADAVLNDGLDMDAPYDEAQQKPIGVAMCHIIEEIILMPRMGNVSENGFSVSWDYSNLSKYYLWLCRKWGVTPDKDVMSSLGLNMIIDRTSSW